MERLPAEEAIKFQTLAFEAIRRPKSLTTE